MLKMKKGFALTAAMLLSQCLTFQTAHAFQMVDLNQIYTDLGSAGGSAVTQTMTPAEYHSKYFAKTLSNSICTAVMGSIANSGANQTHYQELDQMIDALSIECGISVNKEEPDMNFAPIGFRFEGSDTFILWDGSLITINEQAESTLEMTMPQGFQNIITVKKSDIDHKKKNTIVDRLESKLKGTANNLKMIYKDGDTKLLIAGYAYHDRGTYTKDKVAELNERAWGAGILKEIINEKGNREGVSAFIFKDSHGDPETSAAYQWEHPFKITKDVKAWLGYTAGITSRSDFNYVPVPYAFPTAGLSIGKVDIKSVIIPKIGGGVNHGAVVFLFASVPLKKK